MKFENDTSGGVLKLKNETTEIGRLNYSISSKENKLTISFVLVHSEFEGQGMGKLLVEEGIRFARERGLKVYPQCGYARAVMSRMNDVDDIFHPAK